MEANVTGVELLVTAELKASTARHEAPLFSVLELARRLQEKGLSLPNPTLASVLVSNLCFSQNTASLWKLLEQAMASRLVSPLQTLALLTERVVPYRRGQPGAYRLYLELLRRYILGLPPLIEPVHNDLIIKSVDEALQLSRTYGVKEMETGHVIVLFIFTIIKTLIDCMIEDFGFNTDEKRSENSEHLRAMNTLLALEVTEKITSSKRTQVLLHLVHINMPEKFNGLLERLQLIEALKLRASPSIANQVINLICNIKSAVMNNCGNWLEKQPRLSGLFDNKFISSNFSSNFGSGKSACWIPLDVFMENSMESRHLLVMSVIDILTELTKTLQVINQATWQETFQSLWLSALRLMQRGRECLEGPVPQLDARLCMLLAVVPLSMVPLVSDRECETSEAERELVLLKRQGLISSLQVLSQFSTLLSPPPVLASAANDAATKAAVFVSNFKTWSPNPTVKAVGNMLHLIVEACIARNLIDTSIYFWPGYVAPIVPQLSKDSVFNKDSPWSAFMGGAKLTGSLEQALMVTPASSMAELEKLYIIALNGSEEEKSAASRILCGASLVRGWYFQEHVAQMVVNLLSPALHPDLTETGTGTRYIRHMSVLNSVLTAVSSVDTVHILSLYGMVPEVAVALMPICEAFGSLSPPPDHRYCSPDEISHYSVFSCAFLLLLRLWKFYRPPIEHCIAGRGVSVRVELTLDYLLLLHNNRVSLQNPNPDIQPIYIDSFPKLHAWYLQNQAFISSTISSLSNKNPVHQVANMILNMIWGKLGSNVRMSTTNSSSSGSSLSGSGGGPHVSGGVVVQEDACQRPTLPAWEVLEALPFVLEAALMACAYGQLSSRELTTGLRGIVDFLPASLAVIVSYFSAEITRGLWKPVPLNGIEWPSPAANLLLIDLEIKEVLASAGIHIPCCYSGGMPPMLPLPMAVLISLTITFKIDKRLDYMQGIIGQAVENCAAGSSWPSMPIIGALWTQKARKWHDFIVFSCTRAPFSRDPHAVSQLIRSCFSSFLGPSSLAGGPHFSGNRGAVGLLGQGLVECGVRLPVAPGLLYIHSCRTFHNRHYVSEVIFRMVVERAREIATEWAAASTGIGRTRSGGYASLAAAVSKVRQAAMLGSTMLCVAGGPRLVQVLYDETFPTLLLLAGEETKHPAGPTHSILSGYAAAYLLVLSGAFVWGVGETSPVYASVYASRRSRDFGRHMDFLAGAMEGSMLPACKQGGTFKAYVTCFVGLVVRFAPVWVPQVRLETLKKLAGGLRRWNEDELALALLERGGPAAMSAVVESLV